MGKKKGSAKTGGRKKGVPNKRTIDLDFAFSLHGFDPVKELVESVQQILVPEIKANAILKIMEYLYPKRKTTDLVKDQKEVPEGPDLSCLSNKEVEEMLKLYEKIENANACKAT